MRLASRGGRGRRGKRSAPADGSKPGGWDWGALYAAIATATGWRFGDIDALSIDDIADLLLYWRDHPPVHISAHAIVIGLGGGAAPSSGSTGKQQPADDGASAMDQVSMIFGPPVNKFRPPCRMLAPPAPDVQAPAPSDPTE